MFSRSGDILATANGNYFSAYNVGANSQTLGCAAALGGGWWYSTNCDVTGALGSLNAAYSTRAQWGAMSNPSAGGAGNYVIQTVEMKIKKYCVGYVCT